MHVHDSRPLRLFLFACTNESESLKTLDNLGFKDVKVGGYDFFSCGDDYMYHTHFSATNGNGKHVEGTVCCGLLKGCMVKF